MESHSGTVKQCTICGQDCAGRPRVKDPRGRYFCRECYDRALKKKQEATPEPQFLAPDDGPSMLDELIPPPVIDPQPQCPHCGHHLPSDAILCTSCGYNLQTGETAHVTAALKQSARRPASAGGEPWFWLVDLFIRPAVFFRHAGANAGPLVFALAAWLVGVVNVADNVQTRRVLSELSGRTSPLPSTWDVFWLMACLVGILSAAIYVAIWGWWYGVRLSWCGAKNPDVELKRRVLVFSSLVWAIPAMVAYVGLTAAYSTPVEAIDCPMWVDFAPLLLVYVSLWTSWSGATTLFPVRKGLAAVWFIILPGVTYTFCFCMVTVIALVMGGVFSFLEPDVTNLRQHQAPSLAFSYPGNWTIDRADPDYDPSGNLYIAGPADTSLVHVMRYLAENSAEEEMDISLQTHRSLMTSVRDGATFTTFGPYHGLGRTLRGRMNGAEFVVRVFITLDQDGFYLEISETYPADFEEQMLPGLEVIRNSLTSDLY